ncbi:hypothetical protein D3C77_408580 [compost metagenome]
MLVLGVDDSRIGCQGGSEARSDRITLNANQRTMTLYLVRCCRKESCRAATSVQVFATSANASSHNTIPDRSTQLRRGVVGLQAVVQVRPLEVSWRHAQCFGNLVAGVVGTTLAVIYTELVPFNPPAPERRQDTLVLITTGLTRLERCQSIENGLRTRGPTLRVEHVIQR